MPDNPMYERIKAMYKKFGFLDNFIAADKKFRLQCMQEELNEYHEAVSDVSEADALVDLIVFAIGTMVVNEWPLDPIFDAVMSANEAKVVGVTKRGTPADLTKPPGWCGPEDKIRSIIWGQARLPSCETPAHTHTSRRPSGVIKADGGKARLDLIPYDSLYLIADGFAYGAKKYTADSWRTGEWPTSSRVFASIMRHLTKWQTGEDTDPESGVSHLAHAGCQILMMLHYTAEGTGVFEDDRYFNGFAFEENTR